MSNDKEKNEKNEKNGKNADPLAGWAIVIVHNIRLIGRLKTEENSSSGEITKAFLDPVYDLISQQGPNPQTGQGWMTMHFIGMPLGFWSLKSFEIPPESIVIPIESIDVPMRKQLAKQIISAESIRQEFRANASGIRIETAIPKEAKVFLGKS
jgi:hypothetical protein